MQLTYAAFLAVLDVAEAHVVGDRFAAERIFDAAYHQIPPFRSWKAWAGKDGDPFNDLVQASASLMALID